MHTFLKALLITLFAGLPALAVASTVDPVSGNAWTLYAFGNGEVAWGILNAVALMVSEPGYRNFLTFIAVLGALGLGVAAGFDNSKVHKFLGYLVLTWVVIWAMTSLKANILVHEPVTGYTNVVNNVPAAAGIPAAIISETGHWMTQKVEQNFSVPGFDDYQKVSGTGGFALSLNMARDATRIKITDPNTSRSLSNYMKDCVLPMLVNGQLNPREVIQSGDLWATVKSTSGSITTPYFERGSGASQLMYCSNAYARLTQDLKAIAPTLVHGAASGWYADRSMSWMSGAMQSSYTWLSDGAYNGGAAQTTQQMAVVNGFTDAMSDAAVATGNSELVMALQIEQAKQAQQSQWYSAAKLFQDMAGYIFAILQVFIYATIPIVGAAALIPGFGASLFKNYIQVIIWIMLWEPLLAIVNFIISLYARSGLSQTIQGSGISMGAIPAITEQTSYFLTAAGFLASLVPMISWGLVKGSMAFTEFIGAGIGSSMAAGAAQGMASGSVNMDSVSMGNKSMGQENMMSMRSIGQGLTNVGHAGLSNQMQTHNYGGRVASLNGQNVTASESVSRAAKLSETGTEAQSTQTSTSYTETAQYQEIASAMESHATKASEALSKMDQYADNKNSQQYKDASKKFVTSMKALASEVAKIEDKTAFTAKLGQTLKGIFGNKDVSGLMGRVGGALKGPAGKLLLGGGVVAGGVAAATAAGAAPPSDEELAQAYKDADLSESDRNMMDTITEGLSGMWDTVTDAAASAGQAVADGASAAMDYAKENPWQTAAMVASIALAVPSGGASVAAAAALGAGRAAVGAGLRAGAALAMRGGAAAANAGRGAAAALTAAAGGGRAGKLAAIGAGFLGGALNGMELTGSTSVSTERQGRQENSAGQEQGASSGLRWQHTQQQVEQFSLMVQAAEESTITYQTGDNYTQGETAQHGKSEADTSTRGSGAEVSTSGKTELSIPRDALSGMSQAEMQGFLGGVGSRNGSPLADAQDGASSVEDAARRQLGQVEQETTNGRGDVQRRTAELEDRVQKGAEATAARATSGTPPTGAKTQLQEEFSQAQEETGAAVDQAEQATGEAMTTGAEDYAAQQSEVAAEQTRADDLTLGGKDAVEATEGALTGQPADIPEAAQAAGAERVAGEFQGETYYEGPNQEIYDMNGDEVPHLEMGAGGLQEKSI